MGGATSVMSVVRDAFSQQAADSTQWADTIDWTVRCDWLQVANVVTYILQVITFKFDRSWCDMSLTSPSIDSFSTRAVLPQGNRAKLCKFRYVKPAQMGTSHGSYSDRSRKLAFSTTALSFDTTSFISEPDEYQHKRYIARNHRLWQPSWKIQMAISPQRVIWSTSCLVTEYDFRGSADWNGAISSWTKFSRYVGEINARRVIKLVTF